MPNPSLERTATGRALEKRIRFGWGFVAGFVFAGVSWVAIAFANAYYTVAFATAHGLIFGFFAMRYGDNFWHRLFERSWWGL